MCLFVLTHNLKLQVVSQTRGAVHPNQDCILLLGAEADSQPVCSCAWSVIGWPCVHNKPSITSEYVCGSRCIKKERQKIISMCNKISKKVFSSQSLSFNFVLCCMCVHMHDFCSITQSAGVSWWTHQSARQPLLVSDWLNYSFYVTLSMLMSLGTPVSAEAWAKVAFATTTQHRHTHAHTHQAKGWLSWLQPLSSLADTPDNQRTPWSPIPAPTPACIYSAKGGQMCRGPDSYSCSARRMLMSDGANYSVRGR